MNIGSEWKIESEGLNVTLYRKASKTHRKSKGEFEYWRPEGYYATVPNALHALVNQKVRDTHLKDLVTVTKQIEEIHSLIKTAIPV